MTRILLDSASLHGAFLGLMRGDMSVLSQWDQQNLLYCTYLLLFTDAALVPGPFLRRAGVAIGHETRLAREIPQVMWRPDDERQQKAEALTKEWLASSPGDLNSAWDRLRSEPCYDAWSTEYREHFWLVHTRSNQGLFNSQYTEHLATTLGATQADLTRVHKLSTDQKQVKVWQKRLVGEDAELAAAAMQLSGLIRGRYHQYLARDAVGLKIRSHPYRKGIGLPTEALTAAPALLAEELLVKMIIASSFRELTEAGRVNRWIQNIKSTREAKAGGRFALAQTPLQNDALRSAADAAKIIGLSIAAKARVSTTEWFGRTISGVAFGLLFGPFCAPIPGTLMHLYSCTRGKSVAEELAELTATRGAFERLPESVPGRIE